MSDMKDSSGGSKSDIDQTCTGGPSPTPGELEILQVLWEQGESSTREVNEVLGEHKHVGYTTTLKLMQLMTQKGLLGRVKEGKSHRYFPLVEQKLTQSGLLDRFVDMTFGGSRSKMLISLLGTRDVSKDEIQEIKKYLDSIEKGDLS